MKIRFTEPVGGHREGATTDTDPGSAQWLIEHDYAEAIGDQDDPTEVPPRRRGRPPKTTSDSE